MLLPCFDVSCCNSKWRFTTQGNGSGGVMSTEYPATLFAKLSASVLILIIIFEELSPGSGSHLISWKIPLSWVLKIALSDGQIYINVPSQDRVPKLNCPSSVHPCKTVTLFYHFPLPFSALVTVTTASHASQAYSRNHLLRPLRPVHPMQERRFLVCLPLHKISALN